MSSSARAVHVDVAKGLGILIIVYSHMSFILRERELLYRVLFSFHVPLFFFVSGIFLDATKSWRNLAVHRAKTLLLPYLSASLLAACLLLAQSSGNEYSVAKEVLYIFYASSGTVHLAPLWFLPHLFFATIVSHAAIKQLRRTDVLITITIVSIAVGRIVVPLFSPLRFGKILHLQGHENSYIEGLPLNADLVFYTCPFMIWGYLASKFLLAKRPGVACLPILVAALTAFSALHLCFSYRLDLFLRIYDSALISTAEAVFGVILVVALSICASRAQGVSLAFAYIGRNSLYILIFQPMVSMVVAKSSFLPMRTCLVVEFCTVSAAIALSLVLAEIAKRNGLMSFLFEGKRRLR